jgi:hypothetical protein
MAGVTHFNKVSGINGVYVGAKDSEVQVADATGVLYHQGTAMTASPARKVVVVPLGAVSNTTTFSVFIAPAAGSLNACKLVTKNAIAANDTNYWTITLTDKGAAGTGTDKIAEATTKATGGKAFAAYTAWDIGTLSATHKVLAAGDVVTLTLTKTESAVAFAEAAVMLEFIYA